MDLVDERRTLSTGVKVGAAGASGLAVRAAGMAAHGSGLAVVGGIAVVATVAGGALPVIGAPVIGVVTGAVLSAFVRRHRALQPGIRFAASHVLQVAVVLLGAQLSLLQVLHVGSGSLPVMLGTFAACLALAYVAGRRLGISRDVRTLIGVGTAICGASAIAAVSPVIRAKHAEVAYAISTIFLFNIAAVLVFPPLGHFLHLSQHAFGLFAGTAVNDTSSVVAASSTYGAAAGHYAVVVKLTRTLLIIPTCLVLGALTSRRPPAADGAPAVRSQVLRTVPWFLLGFLAAATVNTAGFVPHALHPQVQHLAVFLITVAMSAIGLSTDGAALRRAGPRPLLLGFLLWVGVTATSLCLQLA
jgi:uncharacterized integral membrane protein (TIGR00698 family)